MYPQHPESLPDENSRTPNWDDPQIEIDLFEGIRHFKPVGFNAHFNMIAIMHHMNEKTGHDYNSKFIWDHLKTMYNLEEFNRMAPPLVKYLPGRILFICFLI